MYTCPLCSGQTLVRAHGFVAPWISEIADSPPAPTEGCVCETCDFAFYSHRFDDSELGAIYGEYRGDRYLRARRRWEPWYNRAINSASATGSAHLESRRAFMLRLLADRGPFEMAADFGGDEGQFFPDLDIGRRVVIDPSNKPLPPGIERVADIAEMASSPPDLVIVAHVLEHLNDPVGELSRIRAVMPEQGLLYVEVPQDRPVWREGLATRPPVGPSRRYRYIALDFLTGLSRQYRSQAVPAWGVVKQSEHLNYFSERALRRALDLAGFQAGPSVVDPHSTVAGLRMGRLAVLGTPRSGSGSGMSREGAAASRAGYPRRKVQNL